MESSEKFFAKNTLANATSPYLLQHKENPVWWQEWGEPAFHRAKTENKIIFLSIGYSTCHWCHVMEKECFEDVEVAKKLNDGFVSIKVDREERPDVDDVYMTVLQQISGGGGWPMSVWLTPEGKPFFAGTYFPKENFISICKNIDELWSGDQSKIEGDAEKLTDMVKILNEGIQPATDEVSPSKIFSKFVAEHELSFDEKFGGFGDAPKFPQSMNLMLLMRLYHQQNLKLEGSKLGREKERNFIKEMVMTTLNSMAAGGIYDHLVGGFHRYSTDKFWRVPHFEKMLYDNALMISTFTEAYQLWKVDEYRALVLESLDFLSREMRAPEGGFYSGQDADSEMEQEGKKLEGFFCTYSWQELQENLTREEFEEIRRYWNVSEEGHFEKRNVLHMSLERTRGEKEQGVLREAILKLTRIRESKAKPHRDEKILCCWNGLTISSFAKASKAFEKDEFYSVASKTADFLIEKMFVDGELYRSYFDGKARILGLADDYACLIDGLIELYGCQFDEKYLLFAERLQKIQNKKYWSSRNSSFFRDRGDDEFLISRVREDYDGVTPSTNSLSAWNLLRLETFFHDDEFSEIKKTILSQSNQRMWKYPTGLSQMISALHAEITGVQELVFRSNNPSTMDIDQLNKEFHPYLIIAKSKDDSKVPSLKNRFPESLDDSSEVYSLCEKGACLSSTSSFADLRPHIRPVSTK